MEHFDAAMVHVSPPPFDAMGGLGDALMEVTRETAVSFSTILTVTDSCLYLNTTLITYVQFLVKVEPSGAAMVHVSSTLAAVMGSVTALMEVMKLDVVVSYQRI